MIKSKFPGFDTPSETVFVSAGDADVAFALLGCLEELHGTESATELQSQPVTAVENWRGRALELVYGGKLSRYIHQYIY